MLTQKLKRNNCRICSTKPAIHVRAEPTGFLNSLLLASKLVSMGRASLKESSATKNVKHKGWNRQEMAIEKDASPADSLKSIEVTSRSLSAAALFPFVKFSSSDEKAIARNTPKRHRSNLSKRRRSDTPADNSSRKQNDQKLVTALSPKQSICWSREITQNVDASNNPNDVTLDTATAESNSQHSKMLTNTCHFFIHSRAKCNVCQQQPQTRNKNQQLSLRHADVISADSKSTSKSYSNLLLTFCSKNRYD
ncbi:hypothetical protein F511_30230 [Dorcoceras hygrometricum]|uniref:Uncharacterized protein n=1 Tax=Dorcoceras hygrometricum TaxID=472368 RepID=A0A2Z7AUR2_9LAMI|nr:hypothetical protein F511_30230 [Dorcoceras hygrometricum]